MHTITNKEREEKIAKQDKIGECDRAQHNQCECQLHIHTLTKMFVGFFSFYFFPKKNVYFFFSFLKFQKQMYISSLIDIEMQH